MAIILTYNVLQRQDELEAALKSLGYTHTFQDANGKTLYLPGNMRHHKTHLPREALAELKETCAKLRIKLLRCLVLPLTSEWTGIFGEPIE